MNPAMTLSVCTAQRSATKRTIFWTATAAALMAALTPAQPASAQAQNQTAPTASLDEVVVTGTRITRSGYEAPTPVTVMNAEDINRDAPINIADFVNELPEFANSPSPHNGSSSVSDANGGVNNLNLRALGPNRALVLLDGVRVVASSVTGFYQNGGSVDINEFPDALIKRVDVVTGGASAAYGSDALSGVVNFILDKNFTGVKATLEGGETTYGDDGQYNASLAAGTGFADDRGHFLIDISANGNEGIPNAGRARLWVAESNCQITNPAYNGTNGQPFYLIRSHCGSSLTTPGGLIGGGPLNGVDFGPGGQPRMFNYGSPNDGFEMTGGDWQEAPGALGGVLGTDTGLDSEVRRQNIFNRTSYDITDHVKVYMQYDFSQTESSGYCCVSTSNLTIQSGNPFIPASIQRQMAADGLSSFQLNTYNSELGVAGSSNTRKFYQYLFGSSGDFDVMGEQWNWDAYVQRSETDVDANTLNNTREDLFALATDVVTNPANGLPICASTLSNPGNGCVPYNPMGTGVNSPAAINYVKGDGHLQQYLRQDAESVTLRGAPLSTWAGPVSVAAGLEHRKESAWGDSTAADQAIDFFVGNYQATQGSYQVSEGYIETVVPLAKDMRFAKSLELNGAVRETDYSTSGAVTTWKVGLTYAPFSDVRFRATQSHDIRSPNMGEYFSAGLAGIGTVIDPFKGNQTVPETDIRIGNPGLKPEEADTTGAGVVFQPSWFPGFSASFDYYHVKITNAIASVTQQAELDACYAGNKAFCSFINRNAQGNITTIYIEPSNTAFARTRGFDIEASYGRRLSEIFNRVPGGERLNGAVNARLLVTHVMDLTTATPDGQVLQGAGVNGGSMGVPTAPSWQYYMTLAYDNGPFEAAWTGRGFTAGVQDSQWVQCSSSCPGGNAPYFTIDNNHMPGKFYMDLSLDYKLQGPNSSVTDFFLTVQNLANNNPNGIAILGFYPGPYDLLGRIYRLGVRFKM
jgi:iron complex outermembrane recepter protein